MKLAVLIDKLHTINPKKDTTIAILKKAKELLHDTFYFTLDDLYITDNKAHAHIHSINITNKEAPWAETKSFGDMPLSAFDVILMRKDPPFDMEYIYATYALELAEDEGVKVVNKPQSLRDANEKYFTQFFKGLCPPTIISRDKDRLHAFHTEHKNVIYKPLEGMGGRAVFHVNEDRRNLSVIIETLTQSATTSIMAQKYIPDINKTGDKRILLINGEPIEYALARIPKDSEGRGNLAQGAIGKVVPINKRDKIICEEVGPVLREKGLYFVGIDVIGDYLTEINVTSPTCLQEIAKDTNIDIAEGFVKFLETL